MALRLITGDDSVLIADAVEKVVDELSITGDRSLMLETLSEADYRNEQGSYDAARLVIAAQTPPLFTDKRVLVARHLSRLAAKNQVETIKALLSEITETTDLVLVWERGVEPKADKFANLPKALKEALEIAGGTIISAIAPQGKGSSKWLQDHLQGSSLSFERAAVEALETHIGQDFSRVVGLLRTLEGALGAGATVTSKDVETYAGDNLGRAVPWSLDDAIDRADTRAALQLLPRLVPYDGNLSERIDASFRLLAMLHNRYTRLLRLDGVGNISDAQAAELVGLKIGRSTYPAKKLKDQSRKLGFRKLSRAIELLANADLQLRGTVDWPPELVLEVLVARLSDLSRPRR